MSLTELAILYLAIQLALNWSIFRLQIPSAWRFLLAMVLITVGPIAVIARFPSDPLQDSGGLPYALWWPMFGLGLLALISVLLFEVVLERLRP